MTEKTSKRRKSDGGTYLIIADNTPEFKTALHYAVRMAHLNHGHVAMAKIIEPSEFTGWSRIQNTAKAEGRVKAEADLLALAQTIKDDTGITPTFILREGEVNKEIISIVKGNPSISAVVLAASTITGNPGPLISYFSTKGLTEISVPVILVPGHMKESELKKLL
jgi:hypothetical protein